MEEPDGLRVAFLGGTDVQTRHGTAVRLSTRALALVGHLVAHVGQAQHRAHLAGLLWPDSTEAQARTNLRRELHLLRSTLGAISCLEAEGPSLRWREHPHCEVDVITFQAERRRALDAVEVDEPGVVHAAGTAALEAYQGPYLPGLQDDAVLDVRARLHEECVDLCGRLCAYWLARGDPLRGMPPARRGVQLEPLAEPGYLVLMRLQRALGDRTGAMATYHECATVLERELGVVPGVEVQGEFEVLLADSPAERGGSRRAGLAGVPRPTSAAALVGRDRERAALRSARAESDPMSRFVLVSGEAGVGKSRLIAEFAADARRDGAVVASARCFAATGGLPLAPVAEWLRSPPLRRAIRRLDAVWRVEAERLAPTDDSAARTEGAGPRAKVDAWQRHRFYEGLARAVVAGGQPVVLTLDDLQWCDRASLSWLSFLLAYELDSPLLVVASAREDELARSDLADALRAMRTAGRVTEVRLEELGEEDTARLAAQVLGRDVDPAELALVRAVAGGNPLYLIEALRNALASPGPLEAADLDGVLANRLARLPDAARDVAALASAVGRDFSLDLLIEASDLRADEVVTSVDLLWRHRILRQEGHRYQFSHDLVRGAAYAGISPPRRWIVHRRIAQALELLHGSDGVSVAAEIADQYDRGGQGDRAIPFFTQAARQASAVFAHDEAVRMWDRALSSLTTLPEHRGRDEQELAILLEKLAPLNAFRGYTAPGMEGSAQRVAHLAERLGLPEDRALGLITLWTTVFVQGRIRESLELGRTALASTRRAPALAAQAHFAIAGSLLSLGEVAQAAGHFETACTHAGETDSLPYGTRLEVHARGWWAHAQWLRGDEDEARAASAEAIALAREIEHPYSLAVGLAYGAVTAYLNGDQDHLDDLLAELTDLCERYRFAYYDQWARILRGWRVSGRAGVDAAVEGIRALVADDSLTRLPFWLSVLADIHRREGDEDRARAVLDAAVAHTGRYDDVWWLPELLRVRAGLGPVEQAAARLGHAAALAQAHGSMSLARRSERDLGVVGRGRIVGDVLTDP